jgi:hypothetical protein
MIPKFHPVQTGRPPEALPAGVVLRAYDVYCDIFGAQEEMISDGCRGGFGLHELIAMLYARSFPRAEWQKRFDEALKSAPKEGL